MSTEHQHKEHVTDVKLSVLDLAPVVVGSTPADALRNSLELAQHAERWGYHRYWVAEHHNMPGIASSATSVVIGHLAGGTKSIRVGSGGIMLPNHAPLVIAEQFGTLESLYPGRIDLGLGRAPGSDRRTSIALRKDLNSGEDFPELLAELRAYFDASATSYHAPVRAVPGEGLNIPIYLLGSSDFSARLAGQLGLPFAFASHFSPDYTRIALDTYRSSFQPSESLKEPYVIVGVNAVVADTDEEAAWLGTTMQQQFLNIIRGTTGLVQPPAVMDGKWTDREQVAVAQTLKAAVNGSPEKVKEQLESFIRQTQADELIITSMIYDHQARLHSYELIAQLAGNA
ncbi:luciferase family oxidoreductase group 1 [Paenibacillus sp. 4624]|jgi:luciferase family oxidoreductase group 1|uniref:LLM class flavin-dependent oxidoreductase n=1 Tax=Paenibacillus amylolyticus TaxID=1451 RepID=A0A5M9X033_PAEAM|nr:LLM class flavin-dependent oxidoreductase [Paenibacillus amylolyticus]KAA8787129.1 LLM class flavin-dependent oxidoreductase [Paenibacillus amylolyticus]